MEHYSKPKTSYSRLFMWRISLSNKCTICRAYKKIVNFKLDQNAWVSPHFLSSINFRSTCVKIVLCTHLSFVKCLANFAPFKTGMKVVDQKYILLRIGHCLGHGGYLLMGPLSLQEVLNCLEHGWLIFVALGLYLWCIHKSAFSIRLKSKCWILFLHLFRFNCRIRIQTWQNLTHGKISWKTLLPNIV